MTEKRVAKWVFGMSCALAESQGLRHPWLTCTSSTMLGRVMQGIPLAQEVAEMDGEGA